MWEVTLSEIKMLCTVAPQSLVWALSKTDATVPYLYPVHGPTDVSMCHIQFTVCFFISGATCALGI